MSEGSKRSSGLEVEVLVEALERARYWLRAYGITGRAIEEIDAALAKAREPDFWRPTGDCQQC